MFMHTVHFQQQIWNGKWKIIKLTFERIPNCFDCIGAAVAAYDGSSKRECVLEANDRSNKI